MHKTRNKYEAAFDAILQDPRYQDNLDWGQARRGHPEGTVRAHLAELERNLKTLRRRFDEDAHWKLMLLIHTHDSFKAEAKQGAPITHPRSHASLAARFLTEFCDEPDLIAMVQFHDEPYALWRQTDGGTSPCNPARFTALLGAIQDWNLFLAFNLIDGCTAGKERDPLIWFFREISGKVRSTFTAADILP